MTYDDFLRSKVKLADGDGFPCEPSEVHQLLKPHQRDLVCWAVRGGRRAIFAAFGLGKSIIQLEILRIVLLKLGRGRGLIVCPLGVRQEFIRDAAMIGLTVTFIRRIEEASADGLYLTNYETVRDGKLDPRAFDVVSLDEAAVLRGFGGTKTFREFMRLYEGSSKYRFVATATPSPNDYIELLAYAAFLDIMDVGQAKTRFFKRDSTNADNLTLRPHQEKEFWLWVSSWAMFLQKPSDLGHSDEGYELPPLEVFWHELESDTAPGADAERGDGQTRMWRDTSMGVTEAAREKRDSLQARVDRLIKLVTDGRKGTQPQAPAEGRSQGIPAAVSAGLLPQEESRADARAEGRAEGIPEGLRHEEQGGAAKEEADRGEAAAVSPERGRVPGTVEEAGMGVRDLPAVAGGSGRGSRPSHGERARAPLSEVQRGARPAGRQSGAVGAGREVSDQVVVWCDLNDEQKAIEKGLAAAGISFSSLYGNQDLEEREELLAQWRDRKTTVFLSKPSMYGAGVNLQQASWMLFAGVTFKFNEVIQGIHRIYRFLQTHQVRIDLIYTEAERSVRAELERKWEQHKLLVAKMGEIIREHGLSQQAMAASLSRKIGVERQEISGEGWRCVNNDSVLETAAMPENCVDLIVTSIPFSTQYEYTPSYNDFGHSEDNAGFWRQMDFLSPNLLRILRPGRVAAIHVKDRISPGGLTGLGFQTVQPFHAEAIQHYMGHGFAYLGMITIATDVVRENNQTYRLGWTEQCKDASRMGVGMPEYVLLFRKPPTDSSNGYADVPVVKAKESYGLARWQLDAHGFWRSSGNRMLTATDLDGIPHADIYKRFKQHSMSEIYDFDEHVRLCQSLGRRLPVTFMLMPPHSWHPEVWTDVARMRTLNMEQERKGQEAHLCPLQYDIVDRLIVNRSAEGEVVFDPFGGIGTVPVRAVKLKRVGWSCELNTRYWKDAVNYTAAAARDANIPSLFDLHDEPVHVEAAS